MTITEIDNWFKVLHITTWLDEEWNTINLEKWELSCSTLEEAKIRANEYLVGNWINEEIIIE